jgi:hypothetical protein
MKKTYLLSPIFVATTTSPQHILDNDRFIAALWIVKTVGASGRPQLKSEALLTLLQSDSSVG